jgi:hypothetical protein
MLRRSLAPLASLRPSITGLAVLMLGTIAPLPAQPASASCRLLQVAELEAAIGGKAAGKPSGNAQAVPGTMTLDACNIVLEGPNRTFVHPIVVAVVTNLPMDGHDAVVTRNTGTAREQQWKVAGAKLEQKTVGNAICIMSGRPSVASHTICSIPRGKGYIEVDVTADVKELASIETVAALVQKAVSRL